LEKNWLEYKSSLLRLSYTRAKWSTRYFVLDKDKLFCYKKDMVGETATEFLLDTHAQIKEVLTNQERRALDAVASDNKKGDKFIPPIITKENCFRIRCTLTKIKSNKKNNRAYPYTLFCSINSS